MSEDTQQQERREFPRLEFVIPLDFKVCREETIAKLLAGYTANISAAGLLCHLPHKVEMEDILWLSFDRTTLKICREIEERVLIYQSGVIGKVVRVQEGDSGLYHVGVRFFTREEHNLTNIYPKIHFLFQRR